MNILLVNTYDRGGAANACFRLHEGLLRRGINSKVLVKKKEKNCLNTLSITKNELKYGFLKRKAKAVKRILNIGEEQSLDAILLKKRDPRLELFSLPLSEYDITKTKVFQEADIVNLHWVSNFLDYESFFKNCNKPIVWTLHDMNPFSGGEHYRETYKGFDEKSIKPVKRILSKREEAEFRKIIEYKKKALYNVKKLHIVVLNDWMKKQVENNSIFKKYEITKIENGIDPTVFSPRDKIFSRELLNIPKDKKIVLFVADGLKRYRKGFEILRKAFVSLKEKDLLLYVVGSDNLDFNSSENVKYLGRINDERLMSIAYSAADLYVIPSLLDNLPNTIIESLLCGTPVIGFRTGGIGEMIEDGINGYLIEEIDAYALKGAIADFFNKVDRLDPIMIRERALKKYSLSRQVDAYVSLYKKILKDHSN